MKKLYFFIMEIFGSHENFNQNHNLNQVVFFNETKELINKVLLEINSLIKKETRSMIEEKGIINNIPVEKYYPIHNKSDSVIKALICTFVCLVFFYFIYMVLEKEQGGLEPGEETEIEAQKQIQLADQIVVKGKEEREDSKQELLKPQPGIKEESKEVEPEIEPEIPVEEQEFLQTTVIEKDITGPEKPELQITESTNALKQEAAVQIQSVKQTLLEEKTEYIPSKISKLQPDIQEEESKEVGPELPVKAQEFSQLVMIEEEIPGSLQPLQKEQQKTYFLAKKYQRIKLWEEKQSLLKQDQSYSEEEEELINEVDCFFKNFFSDSVWQEIFDKILTQQSKENNSKGSIIEIDYNKIYDFAKETKFCFVDAGYVSYFDNKNLEKIYYWDLGENKEKTEKLKNLNRFCVDKEVFRDLTCFFKLQISSEITTKLKEINSDTDINHFIIETIKILPTIDDFGSVHVKYGFFNTNRENLRIENLKGYFFYKEEYKDFYDPLCCFFKKIFSYMTNEKHQSFFIKTETGSNQNQETFLEIPLEIIKQTKDRMKSRVFLFRETNQEEYLIDSEHFSYILIQSMTYIRFALSQNSKIFRCWQENFGYGVSVVDLSFEQITDFLEQCLEEKKPVYDFEDQQTTL